MKNTHKFARVSIFWRLICDDLRGSGVSHEGQSLIASRVPMKMKTDQLTWAWKKFTDLSTDELYKIIQLRERVFIIEQNCLYLDCDDKDRDLGTCLALWMGRFMPISGRSGPD
jgi:hypothetical protein